jgi:hypothetical protein
MVAVLTTMLWAQVSVAASATPAAAPVDLRWEAPAGCPGVEAVRAGIARGLPKASDARASDALHADVVLAPMRADVVVTAVDGAHWRAALALQGADWTATRALKGPTCAAVADAAVLVIDLALETELQQHEAPPPPPPLLLPPPSNRSSPVVALDAAGDVGTLPTTTFGAGALVGWRFARARVDLRGAWFSPRTATVASQTNEGAQVGLLSASLRGCPMFGTKVAVGPCAEVGVDRLVAKGFGPINPKSVKNLAPVLGAGLQAEWRLSRWVVPFLAVDAAIPLVRAHFSVESGSQLHRAAAVSFRGAAGLEVRFR